MAPSMLVYRLNPSLTDDALNALFAASWPGHHARDFQPILSRSMVYIGAFQAERLVGFVNMAWDGGIHAFLLDTTVHPDMRKQGVGSELVRRASEAAREHGIEWLHVDFEPHLKHFYVQCGFHPTDAGLMRLKPPE